MGDPLLFLQKKCIPSTKTGKVDYHLFQNDAFNVKKLKELLYVSTSENLLLWFQN